MRLGLGLGLRLGQGELNMTRLTAMPPASSPRLSTMSTQRAL